ncbi:MAG: hypothetical protein ACFCU5_05155 [Pleurocapsa sp.]
MPQVFRYTMILAIILPMLLMAATAIFSTIMVIQDTAQTRSRSLDD